MSTSTTAVVCPGNEKNATVQLTVVFDRAAEVMQVNDEKLDGFPVDAANTLNDVDIALIEGNTAETTIEVRCEDGIGTEKSK